MQTTRWFPSLRPRSPFITFLLTLVLLFSTAWLALGVLEPTPSLAAARQQQAITLALTPFATGLSQPVDIASAGDERLFIVQQSGEIRVVQADGTVLTTPFLNLSDRIITGGEQGLLGMAFAPNSTTIFYVNYTQKDTGDTIIARYQVTGPDPNIADPNSEEIVLTVDQPASNHNAGDLAFGVDGFLYIPLGDGGGGGDPNDNAQDLSQLLGKILRINVTGVPTYTIPTGNPYASDSNPNTRAAIWASGLRNPWRISFDRQTHDLYISDVGQGAYEEVSFQPANSTGGENYGWDCREGAHDYNPGEQSPACAGGGPYVDPIFEYSSSENQSNPSAPCTSITGGFVYRGSAYPALVGHYIVADYCSGKFWSVIRNDQAQWISTAHGKLMNSPSTFGENQTGELFVASRGEGIIYRVATPTNPTVTPTITQVPTMPTVPPDQSEQLYLPYIQKDGTN
ncbi:MAG: PQQ-dependent sugar dehydrogenase [Caldilineaceae bacterium]|nr:PQQ-dependent sugar dehydrogenase [Caldilineaceae bacterium]